MSQNLLLPISKEATYLKGVAHGAGWTYLPRAITLAINTHEDQVRRGTGEPYVNHPLRVTSSVLAAGIKDDIVLSSTMLHDVVEDGPELDWENVFANYGLYPGIYEIVNLLTKKEGMSDDLYYLGIKRNKKALIGKIADRCHNVSTMGGAFSKEKMLRYIVETEDYVLPLCRYGKQHYPEYSDAIFVMKYHIESLTETIKACLEIDAPKE